jgi:CubicO group peptidase (beta-lactamase class C family)
VGAAFKYNQYHPLLLGLILERTTGRSVSVYLQEKIWQPLGMEFPATWSLDSTKHGFEKMKAVSMAGRLTSANSARFSCTMAPGTAGS